MSAKPAARGQLLVIVAFGMVTLIAIAALVIDLGMSWMVRRQEQNAADPAAIAAARYIPDGDTAATRQKMNAAACFYAQQNGFFASDDTSCTAARASQNLQVLWPPSGSFAGDFAGRPQMVLVVISQQRATFFGSLLGRSQATVATGAVAAQETASANSNSLIALDPVSCGAGFVHGNGAITVDPVTNPATGQPYNGGYIQVNSSCGSGAYDNVCSNSSGALTQSGGPASISAPHVYIHGTCQVNGGSMASPVTEGAPQIGDPLAQLIGPRQQEYPAGYCPVKQGSNIVYVQSTPTSSGCPALPGNVSNVTLVPGVNYGGWNFSGHLTVSLQPGIYIIAGGGISDSGATIDTVGGNPPTDPAHVMIFSTDNVTDPTCNGTLSRCVQGSINISGQSSLKLSGLLSGPYRGLVIWQDGRGSSPGAPVSITGQGALDITGTIYAPQAKVSILGNGGTAAVQVISWTWDIGGNGSLDMPYDPTQLYTITQKGLVH